MKAILKYVILFIIYAFPIAILTINCTKTVSCECNCEAQIKEIEKVIINKIDSSFNEYKNAVDAATLDESEDFSEDFIEPTEEHIHQEDIVEHEGNSNKVIDIKDEFVEKADDIEQKLVSLGEFKLTAYCHCSKCNGKWAGQPTASGVMPIVNRTIAVDTNIIPFGTEVVINGNTYIAEDIGGAIKGNRIDIFMNSHQEALNFGVKKAEVFKVID